MSDFLIKILIKQTKHPIMMPILSCNMSVEGITGGYCFMDGATRAGVGALEGSGFRSFSRSGTNVERKEELQWKESMHATIYAA